jgi:TRAP transporter 4TM/12TM fusion protein
MKKIALGGFDIGVALKAVAVVLVLYTLATTYFGFHTATEYVNTHLAFVLLIVGLDSIRRYPKLWPVWILFIVMAVVACGYVHINLEALQMRGGYPTGPDMVIGVMLIVLASYAAYWAFGGWVFVMIPIALAYALWGYLIPGFFNTFKPDLPRLISSLSIGLQGVYGPLLTSSANSIFLFIVLGVVIMITPAHMFFMEFSKLVAGRTRGGAGHLPVVSSAIIGMITGAASANIAITGAITIPPMKEAGYDPDVAAAVEAVASHGGQIMPPVLGAAAFVMSELTGIDYFDICVACTIPAIIYFLSISIHVELHARKIKLQPNKVPVDYQKMLYGAPFVVLPIGLLVVLMVEDFSPNFAAFWTLLATLAVTYAFKKTRPSWNAMLDALAQGAVIGAMMSGVTAGLGIVVKVMTLTGLSIKLPEFIVMASHGNVWIAMAYVFVMSVILGAGLPTLAVYLILAIVTAPVLVDMGINLLAAHLAIFYFANYAGITPPFAPGAMIAAQLAGGSWVRTSNLSMIVAVPALLLPFLWVTNPVLLADFSDPLLVVVTLTGAVIACVLLNVLIDSYFVVEVGRLEWIIAFVAAVSFYAAIALENYAFFGLCFVPLAIFLVMQFRQGARQKEAKLPA